MSNTYSPAPGASRSNPMLTRRPYYVRMGDFTSVIPSIVVFAVVVGGSIVGLSALRRRARRRLAAGGGTPGALGAAGRTSGTIAGNGTPGGAPARVAVADLVRAANIQLVQMDDAIRDSEEELQFALAEFGEQSTHDFAEAIGTAKHRASEAFALKHRLDDEVPDSEQQQRDWSKRILALSDSALALVTAQSRAFEQRRRAETSAPDALTRVRDRVAEARLRLPAAAITLAGLRSSFAPEAIADITSNDATAAGAFDEAERKAAEAEAALAANPLAATSRAVQDAEAEFRRGVALLDAVDRMRDSLAAATSGRAAALERARTAHAEAAALRGGIEDAEAATRIVDAAARLDEVARAAAARTPPHPVADLEALGAASAAFDEALAVARTAQQRLDSARTALTGAIAIAESQIDTAGDFIAGRRGQVGADARTRLAEARRQLSLARLEADPVAALDGARRAATLATDADSLARYDASGLRG